MSPRHTVLNLNTYKKLTIHLQALPKSAKIVGQILVIGGIIVSTLTFQLITQAQVANPRGEMPAACPNEQPISVPNVQKKLIQIGPALSRTNTCIKPDLIFLHATAGGDLDSNWEYFNSGSDGDQTNAHFIVGKDGTIYQTVELYQSVAEYAITNTPYNYRSIGIEMVHQRMEFTGKDEIPVAQYEATLKLVSFLISQYGIPMGEHQYDWMSDTNFDPNPEFTPGVYSHYQIGPAAHKDIGKEAFRAFRQDLQATTPGSSPTAGGGGGRMVPYDKYARPYSWPMTGSILQNYGFTEQAQSLGVRFPGLYPLGDPNVVFSVTNHTEPPLDPQTAKYINPNIDIQPDGNSAGSRAVYATHAGWLTFADWAGPEKGYTIQIESDVEGDGQADLSTRYMRLQAPQSGYFAPDIALFKPSNLNTLPTVNGLCTTPANNDWANSNRWDEQIKQAIALVKTLENVEVPCNLVKAVMRQESGGIEHDRNAEGYMGLMQVGTSSATAGASNCDWARFNVATTQGNITCGIQQIARDYAACNNSYDGAILKYFAGKCDGASVVDSSGVSGSDYLKAVKQNLDYLNSQTAQTPPPASDTSQNPTGQNPVSTEVKIPPIKTIEAEHMKISQSGSPSGSQADGSASLGQALRLGDAATAASTNRNKADRLGIAVKQIKGPTCIADSQLIVLINNQEIERLTVSSTIYKTYYIQPSGLDGSEHTISLQFANPSLLTCQRQLWIDTINYIVTNPNTPTVETISDITIEAEDLADVTEGDKKTTIITDNQASQNKYVAFTSNGRIEKEISIPDSNYIGVRARGDVCGEEVSPIITIKLDDQEVFTVGLNRPGWTEFSTDLKLPTSATPSDTEAPTSDEKTYLLSIEFTNDQDRTVLCDINAYVDLVRFVKYETSQSTASTTSLIGKTKYVAYNQLIGYVSSSRGTSSERSEYKFDPQQSQQTDYYNTVGQVPNPSQTYLSYRIMYNNPNLTTFPQPDQADAFINAKVDNPYIVETDNNTVAGSLKTSFQEPLSPMYFFCALRTAGNSVKCINTPNP